MKIAVFSIVFSALTLCLAATQGGAQITLPSKATVHFAMPQSVDPDKLTFLQFDTLYTLTDTSHLITGQLLSTTVPGGGGGLNLFGDILAPSGASTIPVQEVDFYTTYTGTLTLISTVGTDPMSGLPLPFTPWYTAPLTPLPGYVQGYRFFKTLPTQDNLNQLDFALLNVEPDNVSDPAFLSADFAFRATAVVPEPGAFALLGGLYCCGGLLWRRRSRRNAR